MKVYYLNGIEVDKPEDVIINGLHIYSPSDSQIIESGYEVREISEPEPELYLPTLEELVEQKIRERYSINQEFEVQRKRYSEPDKFQAYYDYVEECIQQAKEELNSESYE